MLTQRLGKALACENLSASLLPLFHPAIRATNAKRPGQAGAFGV
jgi:hypothetical protein